MSSLRLLPILSCFLVSDSSSLTVFTVEIEPIIHFLYMLSATPLNSLFVEFIILCALVGATGRFYAALATGCGSQPLNHG
jgi:hypothetical protein